MAEINERVAALEEGHKHLATKADLEALKGDLAKEIAHIDGQLEILVWAVPLTVAVVSLLVQYFGPRRNSPQGS